MKKRHFKRNKPKQNHQVVRKEPSYPTLPQRIEDALINGNLISLTPQERINLYMQTCKSLKLNPLTKPFGYILFKGWGAGSEEKLVLYATRNCTDQLRSIYGAGDVPGSLKRSETETEWIAEIAVQGRNGRVSQDIGVVLKADHPSPKDKANGKMKVVTKARRRATLALYGLGGIVDESELDTMNVIGGVTKEGRIWRYATQPTMQRELVDGGPPTSDVGRKQLEKVESFDKEFASGVATTPMAAPAATASKPAQGVPPGHARTGDSPRQPVENAKLAGGSPSPPQAPNSTLNRFNKPPATSKPDSRVPTLMPPQARIPVKVDFVKWTPNGKGLEVTLEGGKRLYCFDNKKMGESGERLQDLLLNAQGQMAIFETKESKAKDNRVFTNIIGLIQLGDREWDNGYPVIRREPATKQREPGEGSEF